MTKSTNKKAVKLMYNNEVDAAILIDRQELEKALKYSHEVFYESKADPNPYNNCLEAILDYLNKNNIDYEYIDLFDAEEIQY